MLMLTREAGFTTGTLALSHYPGQFPWGVGVHYCSFNHILVLGGPTGRPAFITCCSQGNDSKALGRHFYIRWNEARLENDVFICLINGVGTAWAALWMRRRALQISEHKPSTLLHRQRAFAKGRVQLQLAAVIFLQQGVCSSKVPISWPISVSCDSRQNVFLIH